MVNGLIWANRALDQGALIDFYNKSYQIIMNPMFNWKPYWGFNSSAVLIHFHGPKPADYAMQKSNQSTHTLFDKVFAQCIHFSVCQRYVDIYYEWVSAGVRACVLIGKNAFTDKHQSRNDQDLKSLGRVARGNPALGLEQFILYTFSIIGLCFIVSCFKLQRRIRCRRSNCSRSTL